MFVSFNRENGRRRIFIVSMIGLLSVDSKRRTKQRGWKTKVERSALRLCVPVIPALERLRQEDQKFKVTLS